MSTKTEATVDDLYRVPENGKAEIVNGELVLMSPTGGVPGRAAGKIFISLHDKVIRVFRSNTPNQPTIYSNGDTAEAEPAVPSWTMPVNSLLE